MSAWAGLEQTAGALITASILLDVFLTVLYARMGSSILADHLARYLWAAICRLSKLLGKRRPLVLSFGGPVIVVAVVAFWVALLILGQALIFHPALGTAITVSSGPPPRDFAAAVFAAGCAVSTVGGPIQPNTSGYRLLFLFDSLTGLSILTLTVTYIVEIYNALLARNTLALKLYLLTRRTGDAAELVAGLGAGGDFSVGYSMIAEAAAEITSLKESHNFYPILFYFRFRSAYYSVSMMSNIALDAVTLLHTALDKRKYGWLADSGAVVTLKESAMLLVDTLQQAYLPNTSEEAHRANDSRVAAWRRRYASALVRLQKTGLATHLDPAAGADAYVAMRREWDPFIRTLAPSMGFDMEEIDPALAKVLPKLPSP